MEFSAELATVLQEESVVYVCMRGQIHYLSLMFRNIELQTILLLKQYQRRIIAHRYFSRCILAAFGCSALVP